MSCKLFVGCDMVRKKLLQVPLEQLEIKIDILVSRQDNQILYILFISNISISQSDAQISLG